MKLENLSKSPETKARKRVGRGPGSGMGKTATRGLEVVLVSPLGSRVDKLHYTEEFLKEDSIMQDSELNMQQLIYLI